MPKRTRTRQAEILPARDFGPEIDRRVQETLIGHLPVALSVLRNEMFNSRSAATRMRAAGMLANLGLRAANIEKQRAQLAELKALNPTKAALAFMTEGELELLVRSAENRGPGESPTQEELAVSKEYDKKVREIQALKMRGLIKELLMD